MHEPGSHSRRLRPTIAGVLLILLVPFAARAGTYTFREGDLVGNPGLLAGRTERLRPGDRVIFKALDGSTRVFDLGAHLADGTVGRVFVLAGTDPPRVVKFPFGTQRSRDFFRKEIDSDEHLRRMKIPRVPLRGSNYRFFIEKDFVSGMTLEDYLMRWDDYPEGFQAELARDLNRFIAAVEKNRDGFGDLRGSNIMYEPGRHEFVFADPGGLEPGFARESAQTLRKYIDINFKSAARKINSRGVVACVLDFLSGLR